MANWIGDRTPDLAEKVRLMGQDTRYEVADGEAEQVSLAHLNASIKALPAPPKVPKVFLSNNCQFNCAYCGCRSGRQDKRIYTCAPRELAELSVRQSAETGSGIFLSSAIFRSADYTQELLIETLRIIRGDLGYRGYVHAKVMPGADPALIQQTGRYASRLSVNIEVAKSEGYGRIARNKTRENILTPMAQISRQIQAARGEQGPRHPAFATSQVTQIMAGSTGEDDTTILRLSRALYRKYALGRVYYTPFHYQDPAAGYGDLPLIATPAWRVGRLYQADRLMQLYGFTPEEIAPDTSPRLPQNLDPKLAWALRNLHRFPIEVNKADYGELLRIPGIGVTYARRILAARRYCALSHDALRRLGVSLGRSRHFLTCGGRYTGAGCDNPALLRRLLRDPQGETPQNSLIL